MHKIPHDYDNADTEMNDEEFDLNFSLSIQVLDFRAAISTTSYSPEMTNKTLDDQDAC